MESKKLERVPETNESDSPSDERVIKVSLKHYQILQKDREEVNADRNFKKKISVRRYVEKLIEDFSQKCVPDLKKEREQSEDWLRMEHQKKAPNVPFFDWLKTELSKGGRPEKQKTVKVAQNPKPLAVQNRNGGVHEN